MVTPNIYSRKFYDYKTPHFHRAPLSLQRGMARREARKKRRHDKQYNPETKHQNASKWNIQFQLKKQNTNRNRINNLGLRW